jgi:uncharacterized protein
VLSFSEALYEELSGSGVTVTCVCPGATHTAFAERAKMQNTNLFKAGAMSAAEVAIIGYKGTMRGKPLVITGMRNWLLAQSVRFGPRAIVRKVVRGFQESRA